MLQTVRQIVDAVSPEEMHVGSTLSAEVVLELQAAVVGGDKQEQKSGEEDKIH